MLPDGRLSLPGHDTPFTSALPMFYRQQAARQANLWRQLSPSPSRLRYVSLGMSSFLSHRVARVECFVRSKQESTYGVCEPAVA